MRNLHEEINNLASKHFIRQAIIALTQDRYDNHRLERCDCNKMLNDLKLSGYFQGQAILDTGKNGRILLQYSSQGNFGNPLCIQVLVDEKSLLNQRI